jgi:hypothetical protein
MKIKKLNNNNFTMGVVKDLGIVNKRRTAIFECKSCKKHITFRVDSPLVKNNNGKCKECKSVNKPNANGRLGKVWINMNQRCHNKNNPQFKDYGERGIYVCDEWRDDFNSFKLWAKKNGYKDNLFIDRIDNDKGYTPSNCRFVDRLIQNQNRRIYSSSSSNYRGVCKYKNKWRVRISIKNKRISLGLYDNKEDAARAYNNYIINNNLPYILNIIL